MMDNKVTFVICSLFFLSAYSIDPQVQKEIIKKNLFTECKAVQVAFITHEIKSALTSLSGTTVEEQKEIIRKIMLSDDVQKAIALSSNQQELSSNQQELYDQVKDSLSQARKFVFDNAILEPYSLQDPVYTWMTMVLCQALNTTQHVPGTILTSQTAEQVRNFEVKANPTNPNEITKLGALLDKFNQGDPNFYNNWRERAILRSMEIQSLALAGRQPVSSKPWYQFW